MERRGLLLFDNLELAAFEQPQHLGQLVAAAQDHAALADHRPGALPPSQFRLLLDAVQRLLVGAPKGTEDGPFGEARDGDTAVEAYLRLRPDVMLIDLNMPGGGGFEAIRRVRAQVADATIRPYRRMSWSSSRRSKKTWAPGGDWYVGSRLIDGGQPTPFLPFGERARLCANAETWRPAMTLFATNPRLLPRR